MRRLRFLPPLVLLGFLASQSLCAGVLLSGQGSPSPSRHSPTHSSSPTVRRKLSVPYNVETGTLTMARGLAAAFELGNTENRACLPALPGDPRGMSCPPCGPLYCLNDPALASAIAAKKAQLAADGYPERLLQLIDRYKCVGCVRTAPDSFSIMIEFAPGHEVKDGSGTWTHMIFHWTAQDEARARVELRQGTIKSFYVFNSMESCPCCGEKDPTLQPDYNATLEMNTGGMFVYEKPSDLGSNPPDLENIPPNLLQTLPPIGTYTKPPRKQVHVMCPNCEALAEKYNTLAGQLDALWDSSIALQVERDTLDRQVIDRQNQIDNLQYKLNVSGYSYYYQPQIDDLAKLNQADNAKFSADYDKLQSVEQQIADVNAEMEALLPLIRNCEETECRPPSQTSPCVAGSPGCTTATPTGTCQPGASCNNTNPATGLSVPTETVVQTGHGGGSGVAPVNGAGQKGVAGGNANSLATTPNQQNISGTQKGNSNTQGATPASASSTPGQSTNSAQTDPAAKAVAHSKAYSASADAAHGRTDFANNQANTAAAVYAYTTSAHAGEGTAVAHARAYSAAVDAAGGRTDSASDQANTAAAVYAYTTSMNAGEGTAVAHARAYSAAADAAGGRTDSASDQANTAAAVYAYTTSMNAGEGTAVAHARAYSASADAAHGRTDFAGDQANTAAAIYAYNASMAGNQAGILGRSPSTTSSATNTNPQGTSNTASNPAGAKPGSAQPQPTNTETTVVEYREGPAGPGIVRQVTQQPPNAQSPLQTAPAPGSSPGGAAPKINMGEAKPGFSQIPPVETETPAVDYRAAAGKRDRVTGLNISPTTAPKQSTASSTAGSSNNTNATGPGINNASSLKSTTTASTGSANDFQGAIASANNASISDGQQAATKTPEQVSTEAGLHGALSGTLQATQAPGSYGFRGAVQVANKWVDLAVPAGTAVAFTVNNGSVTFTWESGAEKRSTQVQMNPDGSLSVQVQVEMKGKFESHFYSYTETITDTQTVTNYKGMQFIQLRTANGTVDIGVTPPIFNGGARRYFASNGSQKINGVLTRDEAIDTNAILNQLKTSPPATGAPSATNPSTSQPDTSTSNQPQSGKTQPPSYLQVQPQRQIITNIAPAGGAEKPAETPAINYSSVQLNYGKDAKTTKPADTNNQSSNIPSSNQNTGAVASTTTGNIVQVDQHGGPGIAPINGGPQGGARGNNAPAAGGVGGNQQQGQAAPPPQNAHVGAPLKVPAFAKEKGYSATQNSDGSLTVTTPSGKTLRLYRDANGTLQTESATGAVSNQQAAPNSTPPKTAPQEQGFSQSDIQSAAAANGMGTNTTPLRGTITAGIDPTHSAATRRIEYQNADGSITVVELSFSSAPGGMHTGYTVHRYPQDPHGADHPVYGNAGPLPAQVSTKDYATFADNLAQQAANAGPPTSLVGAPGTNVAPSNPPAAKSPSTNQPPPNSASDNPSNSSLDTSAFNDDKALEEHLKEIGKTPDDAAMMQDIIDQVERSLALPDTGTGPEGKPAAPGPQTPQTAPGTTQSSTITPSTSPTTTTNVAASSNCGAGQVCGGANIPCQPGANCGGTSACGPGQVCTSQPGPCQNNTDCGTGTCGPGQTCTAGNGAEQPVPEIRAADPVIEVMGALASKPRAAKPKDATAPASGNAANKANETKISTPPMQSGAAAAGRTAAPAGKGTIPGGGGSSAGDPAPPDAPPIPPPPTSSPASNASLVPRIALPTCWPAGTDRNAACQAWLAVAMQNQDAANRASQAVTSAQNDLNQAQALDAAAQAWTDYSEKLNAFSGYYASKGATYTSNAAAASSDQSAAQWQQLAADAAQQSKDFSDQAGAAATQAEKIKQQADGLRTKLDAAKADEAAKTAAAADSWKDYQNCLSLPVCPPEEKPLNVIGGGNPIGNKDPTNNGSNGANVIGGGNDGGLGGLLGSLFGGLSGFNGLNNSLFGNASGAPTVQNIVVTLNININPGGAARSTVSPADNSGSLQVSPQRIPTARNHLTAHGRARFKLVAYHSGSPSRAPSPDRSIADSGPSKFLPRLPSAEGLAFSIVSKGNLGNGALEFQVHDPSGKLKGNFSLPEGMVLEPLRPGTRNPVNAAGGGTTLTQQLTAYCLDMAKLPPEPGQLYRLASPAVQEKYKPIRAILQAGAKLAAVGQLHPDSDAAAYADFIRQHALWAELEHWNEEKFTEVFLERTKKNAEHLNVKWTKEMENTLLAAAPGRWRDIAMVLDAAHGKGGAPGAP